MILSGGITDDLFTALQRTKFLTRQEALKRGVKKGVALAKNATPESAEKATKYYVHKE